MIHRVYMKFEQTRRGWHVEFLADGLRTVMPKKLLFREPGTLREMFERGSADHTLASRQSLEHGIKTGKGGVYLDLSDEQRERLR